MAGTRLSSCCGSRFSLVCRSWFHAWRHTSLARAVRAAKNNLLVDEIRAIFETSKQRYGAPRIHADMRDKGRQISKKTVSKLMKRNGIHASRRKRGMPMSTDSRHPYSIAPNLLDRNFKITVPDTVCPYGDASIAYRVTARRYLLHSDR
jgi:putative transposase